MKRHAWSNFVQSSGSLSKFVSTTNAVVSHLMAFKKQCLDQDPEGSLLPEQVPDTTTPAVHSLNTASAQFHPLKAGGLQPLPAATSEDATSTLGLNLPSIVHSKSPGARRHRVLASPVNPLGMEDKTDLYQTMSEGKYTKVKRTFNLQNIDMVFEETDALFTPLLVASGRCREGW